MKSLRGVQLVVLECMSGLEGYNERDSNVYDWWCLSV